MASGTRRLSTKRKFVADGVFRAEVYELLQKSLFEFVKIFSNFRGSLESKLTLLNHKPKLEF